MRPGCRRSQARPACSDPAGAFHTRAPSPSGSSSSTLTMFAGRGPGSPKTSGSACASTSHGSSGGLRPMASSAAPRRSAAAIRTPSGSPCRRRGSRARPRRPEGVLHLVGPVDHEVAGAHLVHGLVLPRQTGAAEDEVQLFGRAVRVRRRGQLCRARRGPRSTTPAPLPRPRATLHRPRSISPFAPGGPRRLQRECHERIHRSTPRASPARSSGGRPRRGTISTGLVTVMGRTRSRRCSSSAGPDSATGRAHREWIDCWHPPHGAAETIACADGRSPRSAVRETTRSRARPARRTRLAWRELCALRRSRFRRAPRPRHRPHRPHPRRLPAIRGRTGGQREAEQRRAGIPRDRSDTGPGRCEALSGRPSLARRRLVLTV